MRTAIIAALTLLAVTAEAQSGRSLTVRVKTPGGQPVPYAVISVDGAPYRIADESGALTLVMASRDSLPVLVKRIGFRPFDGWAKRGAGGDNYEATMQPLAAVMDTVRVTARQVTPLSRTGFYDRVDRVKKSAMLGEFISPEELEVRNLSRLSDMLQGRQYSRIATFNFNGRRQPIVQGRARCPMNIIVDGQYVKNTTQEANVSEVPLSIRAGRSSSEGAPLITLDEIVDGRSIMGIEIYPSIANAPAELIPTASHGGCGLVAIWTGPRR
ncbi:MAG: hypothetical protein WC700_08080 [Gemmatimonadaceae bacterium]|jgi:hypothetical protein